MAKNTTLSDNSGNISRTIKTPFSGQVSTVYFILFGVLLLLVLLHLSVHIAHLVFEKPMYSLTELFDMDREANVPAFFNGVLFLIGAFMFYLAWLTEPKPRSRQWSLMSLVFTFLAIDESSHIHEKLMLPMFRLMNDGELGLGEMGWLFFAWIIPYGIATIALAIMLLPWLMRLPKKIRIGLILSGAVYVSGAIFAEAWSGKVAESMLATAASSEELTWLPCDVYLKDNCFLYNNIQYIALYTIEEILEMSGLILCIGVLFNVVKNRKTQLTTNVMNEPLPNR